MPRLLVFLPSEKVIIDGLDQTLAILGVLGGIELPAAVQSLPVDAGVPMRWHVLTMWKKEPGDETREFEQRVQLVAPSGRVVVDGTLGFRVTERSHRNRMVVQGFPVYEAGDYILKLSLREAGEAVWRDLAEYPMFVSHVDPTKPPEAPEHQ